MVYCCLVFCFGWIVLVICGRLFIYFNFGCLRGYDLGWVFNWWLLILVSVVGLPCVLLGI